MLFSLFLRYFFFFIQITQIYYFKMLFIGRLMSGVLSFLGKKIYYKLGIISLRYFQFIFDDEKKYLSFSFKKFKNKFLSLFTNFMTKSQICRKRKFFFKKEKNFLIFSRKTFFYRKLCYIKHAIFIFHLRLYFE